MCPLKWIWSWRNILMREGKKSWRVTLLLEFKDPMGFSVRVLTLNAEVDKSCASTRKGIVRVLRTVPLCQRLPRFHFYPLTFIPIVTVSCWWYLIIPSSAHTLRIVTMSSHQRVIMHLLSEKERITLSLLNDQSKMNETIRHCIFT